MTSHWVLNTHGDPIGTIQDFFYAIWRNSTLDGILVPSNGASDTGNPLFLKNPQKLKKVNPFKPLMSVNAARLVFDLLEQYPQSSLAVLLRPCESRALVEMVKHSPKNIDMLLTINIDCLGTYPPDDYYWRAERKGSGKVLAVDALKFARQGGIMVYRYRPACQMCAAPDARGADININVIGLPVREHILITARDQSVAERVRLEQITDRPATKTIIDQHEITLAKMTERRKHTQERVVAGLGELVPRDIESLIEKFEDCGKCQSCLENCPICYVAFPRPGVDQKYLPDDVMRWLISCAGCGMCEQACPQHQPLTAIFTTIQQQLARERNYAPGLSFDDPVPIH